MNEIKEKKLEDIKKEAEEKKCLVQRALYFVDEFLAGPMCGRCFPCSFGSYEARIRLRNLSEGIGSEEDILRLKRIAENMLEASMCKKGKDTAKFIMDYIDTEAFRGHLTGVCPEGECHSLIKYVILPEKCTMCGICLDACKDYAIIGEKKKSYLSGYQPYEIAVKRCTKCGDCIKVCPFKAIEITTEKEAVQAV
ncbi:MAG: 4Fe-4S dicluster domain-containing protein [Nitrospirae bacterium]|nr:4Fe-4S dicluster domain-containing protein [Nitrospirota bacterium]